MRLAAVVLLSLTLLPGAWADKPPVVVITTSMGTIKAEIDTTATPITAANFLRYVDDKFHDDTIFNRVIAGFVIQAGGYDVNLKAKGTRAPIKHEGSATRKNKRGTLAMAREGVDSATSHFFINVADNDELDWKDPANPGYTVFGKVIAGMDVVDKIAKTPTAPRKNVPDVPVTPVVIKSIRRH